MTARATWRSQDALPRGHQDGTAALGPDAAVPARSGNRRGDLPGSFTALLDPATAWYRRWYFLLRLDEELEKARRTERPTAVIGIKLPIAASGLVVGVSDRLRGRLACIANAALRPGDFPGCIGDDQLAVFLPGTDWLQALPLAEKLGQELNAFSPRLGLAVFPADGRDALELLLAATEEEPKPATLIDFEAYHRRGELEYLL
ncbi:MAG: hypothetical protein GEU75_01335 [Dehalococcoidia bacterium]|nr:hypothetical protein [Dehalococcoidia bacterium]